MSLNIKKAMQKRGLNGKEVAARMGISDVALSQHINGNPSVSVLERIAKALDCDIVELFEPLDDHVEVFRLQTVCQHCGEPTEIEVKIMKKPCRKA